jgi:hypothetical protein
LRLSPCPLLGADVVIAPKIDPKTSSPSSTQAQLLFGPAMARAVLEDRKVYPYRIVRRR